MMMTQTVTWRRAILAVVAGIGVCSMASIVHAADASGSYDGNFQNPKTGEVAVTTGVLSQTGKQVSGTITFNFVDQGMTGAYTVSGKGSKKKLKVKGTNGSGAKLKWKGKWTNATVVQGKAKVSGGGGKVKGTLMLNFDPTGSGCESAFFEGQVMGLVMRPVCAACHTPGGVAAATTFRVTSTDALATQASIARHINLATPAASPILQKPLAQVAHGGGQQLSPGGSNHQILEEWVNRVASGQQCDSDLDLTMEPLSSTDLITRASMDLTGKRPSLSHLDAMEANRGAFGGIVDSYLASDEFLERVKDVYDDALLVRREDNPDEDRATTAAIYGEALELIGYIVKNDRPFTEIGTATYTVANAEFQGNPNRMPYPMTPVSGPAWQPAQYLDGRPHAGLLSTSAFYEVWDTNDTNKNRRRANRWSIVFHCYDFLETPVDVTRDVDNADEDAVLNAVTSRADCVACHATLDPLASFLFPLDWADGLESDRSDDFWSEERADYWRTENRRPPAVYGVPGLDLTDMGRLMTQDDKFAQCQTRRAFEMLFLRKPKTTDELTEASAIAAAWRAEDNYNYRALVKRWMMSRVYSRKPANDDAEWVRRVNPERLEKLIADVAGFTWTREAEAEGVGPIPRLTSDDDGFKIILGGINGTSVTARNYAINASVALVHRKVAALAAADLLENDLARPDGQRKLLNGVRGDEDPVLDEPGIRTAIAGIARRLYSERLTPDSPSVDTWFVLYELLHRDRSDLDEVPGSRAERAWRGLLAGMLRSPKILLY
jgi:hypothetical protein